jgi:hypothetical protein
VTDDLSAASLADRGEHADGALEAVEGVGLIVHEDFKRFMIGIAAFIASFHVSLLGGYSWKRIEKRDAKEKVAGFLE